MRRERQIRNATRKWPARTARHERNRAKSLATKAEEEKSIRDGAYPVKGGTEEERAANLEKLREELRQKEAKKKERIRQSNAKAAAKRKAQKS